MLHTKANPICLKSVTKVLGPISYKQENKTIFKHENITLTLFRNDSENVQSTGFVI